MERKRSLSQRRTSCKGLDPLLMPTDEAGDAVFVPATNTNQDVIDEGGYLFQNFVVQEIERESPSALNQVDLSTPLGYQNPVWARTGRDLRLLADEFARTKEREAVRQRANGVPIDIAYDEFRDMLSELFQDGEFTNERIIVFFYFCSDITIRSLQKGKDMFQRFFTWCCNFITENVCLWVQNHGGWSQVFRSSFDTTNKMLLWALAVIVVSGFIGFRYWRS